MPRIKGAILFFVLCLLNIIVAIVNYNCNYPNVRTKIIGKIVIFYAVICLCCGIYNLLALL